MLDLLREKIKTAQDKDIEDKKGTQPKRYYAKDAEGDEMSKSTKDKRASHFAKNSKKADDDDSAYKPAPGDKSAKTKPSTYTKQFKKMFDEDPCWDTHVQRGMKKKGGKMVPNCVPKEGLDKEDEPKVKSIIKKLKGASKKHAQQASDLEKAVNEDATATAELKAKHADEMERLKSNHEDEMLRLKDRHQRELERQDNVNQSEKDAEQIAKQREAERRKNESVDLEEKSKLVANVDVIFDVIIKKIKEKMGKEYRGNKEKGMVFVNSIAKIVGMKVTDKKQEKGKLFLKLDYDPLEEAVTKGQLIKTLGKIKGVTRKQMEILSTMSPTVLQTIINQLSLVMGEETKRNYKKEYENYHADKEQMKRRAARNKARRLLKDRKNIKGKDVHHKDNNPMNNDKSNLSIVSQNYNRKEPRER